jgi:hypothetical protein
MLFGTHQTARLIFPVSAAIRQPHEAAAPGSQSRARHLPPGDRLTTTSARVAPAECRIDENRYLSATSFFDLCLVSPLLIGGCAMPVDASERIDQKETSRAKIVRGHT